jgi:PEP-CTERM motif
MENETSLDRAKRFLRAKAGAIALTVVPLAAAVALVAPAQASLVLTPSTCDAVPSGSGIFQITPCSVEQLPVGSDGVEGVKLYGDASTTSMFSGFLALNMSTQGVASGTGGAIPISYDFTLSDTFSNAMSWDVYFSVAGSEAVASGSASGVSTGGEITGSFSVDASDIGNAYEYVLHVEAIEGASAPDDTLTIDVPMNSIDVNPVTSAAPEPSTVTLLGSVLVSLAWWRRRRRHVV